MHASPIMGAYMQLYLQKKQLQNVMDPADK